MFVKNQSSIRKNSPPCYNVNDDQYYHGPAWVIKPRLYPFRENQRQQPGPGHYHIPDRSIYERPGKTIGSRFDTSTPITNQQLLAYYSPTGHYRSNVRMPSISITPRRNERKHNLDHSRPFYSSLKQTSHFQTPLFRPLYGPSISRKSTAPNLSLNSPGPTAYPMYEFDEDILPRPQLGFTQKHRQNRSFAKINPPFYYPTKADHQRLPSFSISKRISSKKLSSSIPYYSPIDSKAFCTRMIKPGTTLKGRWSPFVRMIV